MQIPEIRKYIDLYDTEQYLFKVVGPCAKARGYLTFDEFYKIAMWKSARQKQRYLKNREHIEQISREAFSEHEEGRKMDLLCQLEGVSVPTASALLTIVYPERYAVIDVRCLEQLRNMGHPIGNYPSLKTWVTYLDIIRDWAKDNGVTPREMDMAFFAMHREGLEAQTYKNLYR